MKIEAQPLEDRQVKLVVEFESELLIDYKQRAARRIARQVKIAGFRPGKAPYNVVVRQIGEGPILEEAIELLVDDQYPKVIEESGIKPYGPGSLEKVASMDPPILEFIVPLEAEVILGDYKAIRKPYETPQVSDEQVTEVLDDLRDQQAVLEPVERPVQDGDLVTVKLHAERSVVEEGQSPTVVSEMSNPFLVQTDPKRTREEWPFQGFTQHLVGMSQGDNQDIQYTYPEDSAYEQMKNLQADFHFTVEEIKARTLPALDDTFAASVGDFTSMDALLERVRNNLELQALQEYNQDYDEEILEELVQISTFSYPPQMLHDEVHTVIDNLTSRLKAQNQDMELYLKIRNLDMDGLHAEMQPVAESRLKNTLALMELAKVEELKVEENEFQAEATNTLSSLMRNMDEKESRRLFEPRVYNNVMNNIMANLITSKAIETLRNYASEQAAELALAKFKPETDAPEAQVESIEETVEPAIEQDAAEGLVDETTQTSAVSDPEV